MALASLQWTSPLNPMSVNDGRGDFDDGVFIYTQVTGEKMGGLNIDLVINLPMRIKYRRSASIVTEGARTRRTAVDHGG